MYEGVGECEYMHYMYAHIYVHCILYMVHVLGRKKMEVHVYIHVHTRQMQALLASGSGSMRHAYIHVHVNSKCQTNSVG